MSSELTKIFRDDTPDQMETLTTRERTILALLAQGAPREHISDTLFLSARTVGTHGYNLCKKLGVLIRLSWLLLLCVML